MSSRSMYVTMLLCLLPAGVAVAEVGQCRPSPNCTSDEKPCVKFVTQGTTQSLKPSPAAGTPVIRVRLCGAAASDTCTKDGPSTQTVSVFGYKGSDQIYLQTLTSSETTDTGPYTEVPGLTRLAVRCNSTLGQYCKVAWQLCKKELGVKSK